MLRLEKGHLIVGQDTDGLTNALEIDAPWALKMDKPFFVAGRVTSVGYSPTLARCIGLALVSPKVAAGKRLRIRIERGEEIDAELTRPPFYDPAGERQRLPGPA